MTNYEVKQISTIFSHFYNLEKLKKTLVFSVSKTIFFLIIAVEPLRSCFFWKIRGFHRFHGWGNVQLVFKQNRPLWERLFRCFMHLQWVSLLFAISPLQFLFFLQRQTKNKKQKKQEKKQQTASDPLPLGCAIFCFLLFFVFLVSWCFAFLVRCYFEGLAKKAAGSNSLPLFLP